MKGKQEDDFHSVRRSTIVRKQKDTLDLPGFNSALYPPDRWVPPASALRKMASLIDLQVEYLLTAGDHSATLPNFLDRGCLRKTLNGQIEYDFGDDSRVTASELSSTIQQFKPARVKTPRKQKKRQSVKKPQDEEKRKK